MIASLVDCPPDPRGWLEGLRAEWPESPVVGEWNWNGIINGPI